RADRRLQRSRRAAGAGAGLGGGSGRRDDPRPSHLGAQPREPVSAPHRAGPAGMKIKNFLAMLMRRAHVSRRNAGAPAFQTLLQPMMFVFVFGRVMTTSGLMSQQYKSLLLPGIIALSMIMTGTWAVAMPLVSEFQFTKEIEDRLLAPMEMEWLAVEKVVAGAVQAVVAGRGVIPTAWLVTCGVSLR